MHELVTRWRQLATTNSPFAFEEDMRVLEANRGSYVVHPNYTDYAKSSLSQSKDSRFHLGLLPVPYSGDLELATVFVLMLNPGLCPSDYFGEYNVPQYRAKVIENLQQKPNRRFPMAYLSPNVAWHGGGEYWRGKLNWLALLLTRVRGMEYWDALSLLSKRICLLQMIPYHSTRFSFPLAEADRLHSTLLVRRFVHEEVLPRDNVLILVLRQVAQWRLPSQSNIIQYRGPESRSAHLSPNSRGGEAIALHLGITSSELSRFRSGF